ncbi:MAG: hypothetical protein MJZ34_04740 [Paludibacteraceae bacterium]|nr:hypothetical protein [Paludibacteraceae bacterium]
MKKVLLTENEYRKVCHILNEASANGKARNGGVKTLNKSFFTFDTTFRDFAQDLNSRIGTMKEFGVAAEEVDKAQAMLNDVQKAINETNVEIADSFAYCKQNDQLEYHKGNMDFITNTMKKIYDFVRGHKESCKWSNQILSSAFILGKRGDREFDKVVDSDGKTYTKRIVLDVNETKPSISATEYCKIVTEVLKDNQDLLDKINEKKEQLLASKPNTIKAELKNVFVPESHKFNVNEGFGDFVKGVGNKISSTFKAIKNWLFGVEDTVELENEICDLIEEYAMNVKSGIEEYA